MEMNEIIEQAKENIHRAIADYRRHTCDTEVLDGISDAFIDRLAEDSSRAKQGLRELFGRSPVWDPKLDALVINGTRTHNPDPQRIRELAHQIFAGAKADGGGLDAYTECCIVEFFADPESMRLRKKRLDAIASVAPDAYAEGKKPSRIFKAVCVALGVADETAGSEFQKLYAQFADELTARQIGFRLYVSINPAHFLTMSNPKNDHRGCTLTSCHSLNSTQYGYNSGCTGYARDSNSFIVFTAAGPSDGETLNNRKTTRQVFAYKPGNGLLLQSRFYNTSGGVSGAVEDSRLYRDLVQREISGLEGAPNLWKTYPYCGHGKEHCVRTGEGFGGYADWVHEQFDGKVSIRADHEEDHESIVVGTYGLCLKCAKELPSGLFCGRCGGEEREYCGRCGSYYFSEDMRSVRESGGAEARVCRGCEDEYFTYCDCCGEYYPNGSLYYIEEMDGDYCGRCLDEHCGQCDCCGDYHLRTDMFQAVNTHGYEVWVCRNCAGEYAACGDCGRMFERSSLQDGLCPACRHQEDAEEAA